MIKNKKKVFSLIFISYSLTVFTVSSIPRLNVPNLPDNISADKIAHFFQYLFFCIIYNKFRSSWDVSSKDILLELFFLGILISIFDELHQIPIPGRQFSWFDVIADLLGFFTYISFRLMRFNKRKVYALR